MKQSYSAKQLLSAMEEIDVSQATDPDRLLVKYTPKNKDAIYDVCDLDGRVISTGKLDDDLTEICIEKLGKERYMLWVVDGSEIIKSLFKVS